MVRGIKERGETERERGDLRPDSKDTDPQEKAEEWEATKETGGKDLTGSRKTRNVGSQKAKGKKHFKRKGMVNINCCFRGHIKEVGWLFFFFFLRSHLV